MLQSCTVPLIWCGVRPPLLHELWLLGHDVCEGICRCIAVWFCGGVTGLCAGFSPVSTLGNFGFSRESVGTGVCLDLIPESKGKKESQEFGPCDKLANSKNGDLCPLCFEKELV